MLNKAKKMLSLTGKIQLPGRSQAEQDPTVLRLASALRERFSDVQINGQVITASGNLRDFIFLGNRNHPLLPFNTVRFHIASNAHVSHLHYSFDLKLFFISFLFLGLVSGMLASIDRGLLYGLSIGFLFSSVFLIVNFIVATRRAKRWVSKNLKLSDNDLA